MATIISDNKHNIAVCNSLLRGELSAVETYLQAIEKFAGEEQTPMLKSMLGDHQASTELLTARVISLGGTPDSDSGAWGNFATAVQGAANLLGENSALISLKQGEEHGKRAYEAALADEDLGDPVKEIIRDQLLPRVDSHISDIENLSQTV